MKMPEPTMMPTMMEQPPNRVIRFSSFTCCCCPSLVAGPPLEDVEEEDDNGLPVPGIFVHFHRENLQE
jgi:hypothetical protein